MGGLDRRVFPPVFEFDHDVRDTSDGASWVLLLPSSNVRHALCLGPVHAHVVAHLARTASRLDSVLPDPSGPPTVDLLVATPGALRDHLRFGRRGDLQRALAQDVVIVVSGPHRLTRAWRRDLARLLGRRVPGVPDVAVMTRADACPPASATATIRAVPSLRAANSRPVMARRAEVLVRLVRAHAAHLTASPPRAARRHASDLQPLRPATRRAARVSTTIAPATPARPATEPPAWLCPLLEVVGVEPTRATWEFVPPRGYRSQKVLFRVTDGGRSVVVKVTQDPVYNGHLDAEVRALRRLQDHSGLSTDSVPRALLSTTHAGLRVVIEDDVGGVPYRHASTGTADCPLAWAATRWLIDLARVTARVDCRGTEDRRRDGEDLVARYVRRFDVPRDHATALTAHAERLLADPVPTVMLHGDFASWNLVVDPATAAVRVLDWENARDPGPPGWDLVHHLVSHAQYVAQAQGRHPTPGVVARQWRPGTPMATTIRRSVAAYGDHIGVPAATLASLAVLSWAHQAMKEAARTPAGRPVSSWHHRWLQLVLSPDAPILDAVTLPDA